MESVDERKASISDILPQNVLEYEAHESKRNIVDCASLRHVLDSAQCYWSEMISMSANNIRRMTTPTC